MSKSPSHILVPTDFSPAARAARQLAFQLALKSDALVTLLHVSRCASRLEPSAGLDAVEHLHEVLDLPAGETPWTPSFSHAPDRRRSLALDRLQREVHPEWQDAVEVLPAWRRGEVVEEVLSFIEVHGVDTLVLGTSPRRWRLRWSPGVSDQLLRAAPCRTILVHSPAEDPQTVPRLSSLLSGLAHLWRRPAVRLSKEA